MYDSYYIKKIYLLLLLFSEYFEIFSFNGQVLFNTNVGAQWNKNLNIVSTEKFRWFQNSKQSVAFFVL